MSIASTGSDYDTVGPMRLLGWFMAALIAAVLVGGIIQQQGANYFATQGETENREKAELLLAAMLEDIITEDRARLETTVELYQESNPSLYSFAVADEEGNALLSWSRGSVLEPQNVLMFFPRFYPRQLSAMPVAFEGETFGRITIEWDHSALMAQRDTYTYILGAAVGLLCLFFALFAYHVGRRHG